MIKIMLVDDDQDVADMFAESLTNAGFEVDVFSNAAAALSSCVTCRYALVISDINMPDIDGLAMLQIIRAQRPGMPYIVMSGKGAQRNNEVIQNADAFFAKIDGVRKLTMRVVNVLGLKGVNAGTSQSTESVNC